MIQYKPFYGANPHYLPGKYNSEESKREYQAICDRIVGHKLTLDPPPVETPPKTISVEYLVLRYLDWAEKHYGDESKEFDKLRSAAKVLVAKHAATDVRKFGPIALKAVREAMLPLDWTRETINQQVQRIRRMFAWGVENELVDESVYAPLTLVAGLRKGKVAGLRESKKVLPVEWSVAQEVFPFVPPIIRTMIEVQHLTAMRSDELTGMRTLEMDRSRDVWLYMPVQHKTRWLDKQKVICLGPRVQSLLAPYLTDDPHEYIFSPAKAIAQQNALRASLRRTKLYGKAKSRKPRHRVVGSRYFAHGYLSAIHYGFEKLAKHRGHGRRPFENPEADKPKRVKLIPWLASVGVAYWHPHQLRHTRATDVRRDYGIEGAQVVLGNTIDATELYAEKNLNLAMRIAREQS